jgi:hypothetical protein
MNILNLIGHRRCDLPEPEAIPLEAIKISMRCSLRGGTIKVDLPPAPDKPPDTTQSAFDHQEKCILRFKGKLTTTITSTLFSIYIKSAKINLNRKCKGSSPTIITVFFLIKKRSRNCKAIKYEANSTNLTENSQPAATKAACAPSTLAPRTKTPGLLLSLKKRGN